MGVSCTTTPTDAIRDVAHYVSVLSYPSARYPSTYFRVCSVLAYTILLNKTRDTLYEICCMRCATQITPMPHKTSTLLRCTISTPRMRNFQISDLNLTLTVTLTHPNLNHSQIEQRILQITQTYNLRAAEALSLIHTLIRAMRHISRSR